MSNPHEVRHRELLYQRFSADIFREASDEQTLHNTANRILNRSEVQNDAELALQLRQLVQQREQELRERREAQRHRDAAPTSDESGGSLNTVSSELSEPAEQHAPSRVQIQAAVDRLRRELEERLAHFDIDGARSVLVRISDTRDRYADLVSPAVVERCKMDVAAAAKRHEELSAEIASLERRAVEAARRGDHEIAAAALKRLSSINAIRPALLSSERLEAARSAIAAGGDVQEAREISRELVARERAVAVELRAIARAIHEFHTVSRRAAVDDPDYALAHAAYRDALHNLKLHDKEWLADLIVELDELMDQLHDPTGRASMQVTHFIESVRHALRKIVAEVRAIHDERHPPAA